MKTVPPYALTPVSAYRGTDEAIIGMSTHDYTTSRHFCSETVGIIGMSKLSKLSIDIYIRDCFKS